MSTSENLLHNYFKQSKYAVWNHWNIAAAITLLVSLFVAGGMIVSEAIASVGDADFASVFSGFASYGFGGLMTLGLGYALVGLYKAHKEERDRWLEAMDKHFDRLIIQLKENDDSRAKLAQELRDYIHGHESLSRDLRELIDRLRRTLETNGYNK